MERLGAGSARLPRAFFRASPAARVIDNPWRLTVGEDFRFPGVTGPCPPGTRLLNRYAGLLHEAASADERVYRAFLGRDEPDAPAGDAVPAGYRLAGPAPPAGRRPGRGGPMPETYGIAGVEAVRLRANGIGLHALTAGPADGPLLVLLHGFPEFAYGWRRQVGPLAAAGLRVVVRPARLRPVGQAGRARRLHRRHARRRRPAADASAASVRGVGHDWGAAVAWHLASRNPGGVERAAVLNAVGVSVGLAYARTSPAQMAKSWYIGFFQAPALPELALSAAGHAWLRSP